jgi:hypothetical protein
MLKPKYHQRLISVYTNNETVQIVKKPLMQDYIPLKTYIDVHAIKGLRMNPVEVKDIIY